MVARSVPIELDKLRHLRFSANDIADLEEVMGSGIGEIFKAENLGFRSARAMLWAGLRHEDPTMRSSKAGIQKAGDLIEVWFQNGGKLPDLFEKIDEAMTSSGWFGVKKDDATPSEQEGDGKNSQSAG